MVTQLEDVANQVAQQKIGNQRLRNEAIRKGMKNPWTQPKETTTTVQGTNPPSLVNVTKPGGTLASTYSGLLNNANALGITSSSGSSPTGNKYNSNRTGRMPSWLPSVAGRGVGIISGNGLYGALAQMAMTGASGNWKGAVSQGAGTLASIFAGNKIPGIGGITSTIVGGKLRGHSNEDIAIDTGNSLIGTGLSMANPMFGTVYGLARLFGFDPVRGAIDHSRSDFDLATRAGYHGGYFTSDRGSWSPTAPYNPTGTYSGSGYGNTAGPGSGSNGTPTNYTNSTQHYGYSNPASSYAGQTSSNSDTGED